MTLGSIPGKNIFNANDLDEVLCLEAREYRIQDGPVFIFLAMDAVSRHAHHHHLGTSASLDDHINFLKELFSKYPRIEGQILATALPPMHHERLHEEFPHFSQILHAPEKVSEITGDFHAGFRRMMQGHDK